MIHANLVEDIYFTKTRVYNHNYSTTKKRNVQVNKKQYLNEEVFFISKPDLCLELES